MEAIIKVVINKCFGGFSLSKEAYEFLGIPWDNFGYKYNDNRTDPKLVDCIETLGDKANGMCANLRVVEIPIDIKWSIEEYDGNEWIAEKHRVWH